MKNSSAKIKIKEGVKYIFDPIRKKYLVLTPEEKVRQGFIHFLTDELKFSKNLIRTEMGTQYFEMSKRTDILVFDHHARPFLLVECKAESVPITQSVLDQAGRYNKVIKAPYICITNGLKTFCFEIDFENNQTKQLDFIPSPQV